MNFKKTFSLNKKKVIQIITAFIIAVMLHNIISALISIEEALFFIIAVVIIPVYFIVSLIWTILKK